MSIKRVLKGFLTKEKKMSNQIERALDGFCEGLEESFQEWREESLDEYHVYFVDRLMKRAEEKFHEWTEHTRMLSRRMDDIYKLFNKRDIIDHKKRDDIKIIKEGCRRDDDEPQSYMFWIFKHPFGRVARDELASYIEKCFEEWLDVYFYISRSYRGAGQSFSYAPCFRWGNNHVLVTQYCGLDV